jgi:hypothetical protein
MTQQDVIITLNQVKQQRRIRGKKMAHMQETGYSSKKFYRQTEKIARKICCAANVEAMKYF